MKGIEVMVDTANPKVLNEGQFQDNKSQRGFGFLGIFIIFLKTKNKRLTPGFIMPSSNKSFLIAHCGMNCGICMAYLRPKNKCPGCNVDDSDKPVTRLRCKIKTCKFFQHGKARFCFTCKEYPCAILMHLDKRYRTRYHMSMIENLGTIKNLGINRFLKIEKGKWTCSKCGGIICVHKGHCSNCGAKK